MSTTFTAWSSTPSSSPPPSAEGFAPMSTSTAPVTTHCKKRLSDQISNSLDRETKHTFEKKIKNKNEKSNLSLDFP